MDDLEELKRVSDFKLGISFEGDSELPFLDVLDIDHSVFQTEDLSVPDFLEIPDDPYLGSVLHPSFLELATDDHPVFPGEEDSLHFGFSQIHIVMFDVDHTGDDRFDLLQDVVDDLLVDEFDLRILKGDLRIPCD